MTRYQTSVVISSLIYLLASIAAMLWFVRTRDWSWAVAIGGVVLLVASGLVVNWAVLTRPLQRRLAAAIEREDADALDAVLDEAAEMWPRHARMRAFVDANRPVALMFRERWDDAVAPARLALDGPLARTQETVLLNNLAWALAHTGALDEAAAAGERALAGARSARQRSYVNGTVGAICALRGDADRALAHLDAADVSGAAGGALQATRQYYRGVALQAKGLTADATRAFEAACAAAPASTFGRRAASRLRQ